MPKQRLQALDHKREPRQQLHLLQRMRNNSLQGQKEVDNPHIINGFFLTNVSIISRSHQLCSEAEHLEGMMKQFIKNMSREEKQKMMQQFMGSLTEEERTDMMKDMMPIMMKSMKPEMMADMMSQMMQNMPSEMRTKCETMMTECVKTMRQTKKK